MSQQIIRIAFVGGGTGGHIQPLVAVMESIALRGRETGEEHEFHYFGGRSQLLTEMEHLGVLFHAVVAGNPRRYVFPLAFIEIPKFAIGFLQALFKLFLVMPDVLFSKGGPGALPIIWAAWWYRIPIVIHESDITPGLTTLLSAPVAMRIGFSFESTAQYFKQKKRFLSGNPVRPSLLANRMDSGPAKEALGFSVEAPLILVLGGSQGAKQLNAFVETNLADLLNTGQVLHQTGYANFEEVKRLSRAALLEIEAREEARHPYRAVPYLEGIELAHAFSAADIIIARSGSNIFEIALFGKASLLVPFLSAARDHQRANAYEYAKGGAAVVIEEKNLSESIVMHEVRRILSDHEARAQMEAAANLFAKPDAADIVAQEILGLVK